MSDIHLTVHQVACDKHREPFRAHWPHGYETFANDLFAEAGGQLQTEPAFKTPLCERVSRSALIGAYIRSGISREAICQVCKQRRSGTPISGRQPNGMIRKFRHVCFDCLVHRLEMVN